MRLGEVCAAIGLGCIVGTFVEPVTRRPRSWSAATRLAIGVNLAASAALGGPVLGMRSLRAVGTPNVSGANESGGANADRDVRPHQATTCYGFRS